MIRFIPPVHYLCFQYHDINKAWTTDIKPRRNILFSFLTFNLCINPLIKKHNSMNQATEGRLCGTNLYLMV